MSVLKIEGLRAGIPGREILKGIDLDVEQLDASGGQRGLSTGEQGPVGCEGMQWFVASTDWNRPEPDEVIAGARCNLDELRR